VGEEAVASLMDVPAEAPQVDLVGVAPEEADGVVFAVRHYTDQKGQIREIFSPNIIICM
jgi:hypothetical protein